uniref:Uncharacterized protein n=1 Tax=Anguilla anguilla TaxID=7936 RepID=A0A0E9Q4R8_ANGAN
MQFHSLAVREHALRFSLMYTRSQLTDTCDKFGSSQST